MGIACPEEPSTRFSRSSEREAALEIGLSPLQGQATFDETLRECEQAEAAGFDSIWLGEHHNHPLLYPAPLIGLAAVAGRTRKIRLGTGVLLLPLYHPLRVAEEAAMVDVISGGRLILGIGAGYAPEEFAAFGYSIKERGSRLEESALLLQRLWTEENVTHHGRHFHLDNVTIAPRPLQHPRPPIWFGAWAETAIHRAARLGDAWLAGPSATLDEIRPCLRVYREASKAAGKPESHVAVLRYVFVAGTRREAISAAGDSFVGAFERMYFQWPHPIVKRPPGRLTIERLAENRIVLGDPKTCVEEIIRFQRELGANHFICRFSVPGIPRDLCAQSLSLFTREVMPALFS